MDPQHNSGSTASGPPQPSSDSRRLVDLAQETGEAIAVIALAFVDHVTRVVELKHMTPYQRTEMAFQTLDRAIEVFHRMADGEEAEPVLATLHTIDRTPDEDDA